MQPFAVKLNDILVACFNNILRVEEEYLQKGMGHGLTIREMHMIEYIGKAGDEGRTLSEIADFLGVARPSVTVSARKLEGKGFLIKEGSVQDGRVVHVRLSREGRKVYMQHMRFHTLMTRELEDGLDDEEKKVLIRGIEKLDRFFSKSIEAKQT
ncbi:MAG: MarR family transcriptional regulator [Oscillospiraceae bacterium]|jgi:DNA-binding MarR family transcriptional regulator|nr:MarR family transcriptional regulator [Oscillospiraceae bacterium]